MELETPNESKIKNVCVTCLSEGKCENAFILTFQEKCFNDVFASCMGFELSENSDLKYLCLECLKTIIAFYSFKETALKSYSELKVLNDLIEIEVDTKNESEIEDLPLKKNMEFDSIEDENVIETIKIEGDDILLIEQDTTAVLLESLEDEASGETSNIKQEKMEEEVKQVSKKSEDDDLWTCRYCPLVFPKDNLEEIKRHRSAEKRKRINIHPCPVCGKKFSSTRLKVHVFKHGSKKPSVCEVCGKGLSSNQALRIHMMQHEGKKFVCEICKKAFAEQYILKEHMNEHEKKESFLCQTCGKSFFNLNKLRNHTFSHKKSESRKQPNSLICEICGSSFSEKKTLEIHVASHSSNTINCQRCGKVFHHQSQLTVHMWYHVAEFRCLSCFKIYQKDDLKAHKCIQPKEEFKAFLEDECRTCGEIVKPGNLDRHMKKHEKRECNICGETFPNARRFMFHKNSHQLKCDLCDKGFAQKLNYLNHVKDRKCLRRSTVRLN